MPEQPKWTAKEAEAKLLKAGYRRIKSKGGHRIYKKGGGRFVLPFHSGKTLHPKIVKQLLDLIAE